MPVPIVNLMVVILRNSLAPINRVITNSCGTKSQKHPGFIFFRGFGYYCYTGETFMSSYLKAQSKE